MATVRSLLPTAARQPSDDDDSAMQLHRAMDTVCPGAEASEWWERAEVGRPPGMGLVDRGSPIFARNDAPG